MRLKTMKIRKTGPIDKLDIQFGDVNLIVGNNEEGKTTLTDILIHSIFQKKTNHIKSLWSDRFETCGPSDFDMDGALPEDALKYAGLFVIREGDMRWQGRSKGEMLSREMWNEDIKEILYGNDEKYSKISRKAVELMGVSSGKGWMQKLISNAEALTRTAEEGLSMVEQYKDNESRLAELRRKLLETDTRLNSMTDARKISASTLNRELIEKFFRKNDELSAASAEREKLEKKNLGPALEKWDSLKQEIDSIEKSIARQDAGKTSLEERKKEKLESLSAMKKKLENAREHIRNMELDRTKKGLELENEKRDHERELEKWTGKSFKTIGAVLASFLILFLSSMALTGAFALLVLAQFLSMEELLLPDLIAFGSSVFGAIILMTVRLIRSSSERKEKQKLDNRRDTVIRELEYRVRTLDCDLEKLGADALEQAGDIEKLEKDISAIDNGLVTSDLDRMKKDLEAKTASIGELARIYQSYQNAMQEKQKLEYLKEKEKVFSDEIKETGARVQAKFNTVSIAALNEELKKLRKESADANAVSDYDEELFEKLSREKDDFGEQISGMTGRNVKIKTEVLTKIEQGVNALKKDVNQEYLNAFYSETASLGLGGDIFNIFSFGEKLAAFSSKVREDMRLASGFLEVMDRVQSNVQSLIGAVLHTDRFRGAFSKLTNGRYTGIEATDENGELSFSLKNADGDLYRMKDLSTGTRNQLYFAVRLSLAQNFFQNEKGVFLLDDAFLTFDESRRLSALELLADYAKDGWQIIYSSVNERNMESLFDRVFGRKLNKIVLSDGGAA